MAATDEGTTTTSGGLDVLERIEVGIDKGWTTLLWNDPVNLFEVVRDKLVEILEISEEVAHEHTKTAHEQGKAAVFSGGKEKAVLIAEKLGSVGLSATVERV